VSGLFHLAIFLYIIYTDIRVSTLRSAIELKTVFDQIQAAEKAGNLSPEEKKKLEEQAAEKGLQALFKVCLHFFNTVQLFRLVSRERNSKSNQFYAKHATASLQSHPLHGIRHSCGLWRCRSWVKRIWQ